MVSIILLLYTMGGSDININLYKGTGFIISYKYSDTKLIDLCKKYNIDLDSLYILKHMCSDDDGNSCDDKDSCDDITSKKESITNNTDIDISNKIYFFGNIKYIMDCYFYDPIDSFTFGINWKKKASLKIDSKLVLPKEFLSQIEGVESGSFYILTSHFDKLRT